MRVVVAGTTGAIGKQLVPRLAVAGHEVHGMTRSESRQATVAAVERSGWGVDNVVDGDPAPVAEWLPALARILGAEQPMQAPRLAAGEVGAVLMAELCGAANANARAKATRELAWQPAQPSWRQGLAT